MTPAKTVYIALGSNKGNKLKYLQSAVDAIFERVGVVLKISKVYKTPALGFEGDDFFNTCIKVETDLKPKKLLKTLQAIEIELGRSKPSGDGYESREIDLDILFYEDDNVEEANLVIPHPIAKDFEHSILHKSVAVLLEQCKDDSEIEPINIWLKNPKNQFNFLLLLRVILVLEKQVWLQKSPMILMQS